MHQPVVLLKADFVSAAHMPASAKVCFLKFPTDFIRKASQK